MQDPISLMLSIVVDPRGDKEMMCYR